MKVSFIVPIYKVEQYIHQCVESLSTQTYEDIEIVLVDDGSPDRCPDICDEIASKDARVRVVHKPNGGLSDARNAGLLAATGEYVCFVDGDDFWMHKDDLQKLVEKAKMYSDVDFIGFNCSYYYPSTDIFSPWPEYSKRLETPMEKSDAIVELTRTSSFVMSACMKLIKRQFLLDNKLFFIKGLLSEDIPWFISLLDCCKKCMFVNMNIYAYRQGVAGSITHNISQRNVDNLIGIVENELSKVDGRSFTQEGKNCLLSFLAYEYSIILGYLQYLDKDSAKEKYEHLKQYKYLFKYNQDPKVKKVSLVYRLFGLKLTTKLLQLRIKRMYSK